MSKRPCLLLRVNANRKGAKACVVPGFRDRAAIA
jgi:hypothetical protein